MKQFTVNFPVLTWGSVIMESTSAQDLLDDILCGAVEIDWNGKTESKVIVLYNAYEVPALEGFSCEIPAKIEVL